MHIQHPAIAEGRVEFRGYQANIARIAAQKNTLVVLPTGLGKTVVAALAIADALVAGAQRVLVLAPTKPLVEQHAAFFAEALRAPWNDPVHCLTGHVPPAKRDAAYGSTGVICATPQIIQNDIVRGALDLANVDWIVFDECHRAIGEYAYTFIGEELRRKHPDCRRMGLTASPGHDVQKIDEVRQHLSLNHVEIRTPDDGDVREYIQEVATEWETLPLPANMARVSGRLNEALKERVNHLKNHGSLKITGTRPSRKALLETGRKLQAHTKRTDVPPEVFAAMSVQAQAMKILHAIELAETQGAEAFRAFIDKLKQDANGPKPSKATLRIVDDPLINEAYHIAKFDAQENPKMGRTITLVREALEARPDSRVLVFATFRDTVETISEALAGLDNVRPVMFVGQGNRGIKKGLTQKEQQETLEAFKDGRHNVLVATSVAEEGLDIPATDLVVFYEPIPSEIRSIQRRGRTGRHDEGRVVVLMTKGTQDEAAHWTSRRKEQQMVKELQRLRATLGTAEPRSRQQTLAPPEPAQAPVAGQGPKIICDHREQPGGVVKHLHQLGVQVELRALDIGDFVLSDRVCVERKQCSDFIDSMLDGRLFEQLRALGAYPKPLLILEGETLWGHRSVSPEAIMGAVGSIVVDHGIPMVQTKDAEETARLLCAVAKREQGIAGRKMALRTGKSNMSDEERIRFILAGFPGVDQSRADALLAHFGTLHHVFEAHEEELATVEGIGPKTAREIRRVLLLARVAQTV